jgi:pathogenesis-related protein 1
MVVCPNKSFVRDQSLYGAQGNAHAARSDHALHSRAILRSDTTRKSVDVMICPPKVDRQYYCMSGKKHSPLFQSLLIVALLQGLWVKDLSAAALSDAEVAEILAAHNAVRQRVARVESQRLGGTVIIPDLVWDSAVAALAQEWADSLIKRNPPRGEHRKGKKLQQLGLGENWYLAWSEEPPDLSAKAAVESWAEEEKWYDYHKNICTPGKECLHYTQLVWSNTQRLGAGRAVRATDDGRTYVIWVCNYAPAGNIKGERPYSVTLGPAEPKNNN